jgi:hypothetical protein
MLSAAECQAKAKALSDRAETVSDAALRAGFLRVAEQWLDMAMLAERQEAGELAGLWGPYRIR